MLVMLLFAGGCSATEQKEASQTAIPNEVLKTVVENSVYLADAASLEVTELKLLEGEARDDKDSFQALKGHRSKTKKKSSSEKKSSDNKSSNDKASDNKTSNSKSSDNKSSKDKSSDNKSSDKKTENDSKAPSNASGASSRSAGRIDENGSYDSKDEVALYISIYGKLPSNYITKREAQELGWSGGSLEEYAPGKCIGGSYFGNYEGKLPEKKGRKYYECDIDTLGAKKRGAKRIIYSNDGLIYYTGDHYESFELLYDGSGKAISDKGDKKK